MADVTAADPAVRMSSARTGIGEGLVIRGFDVPSGDYAVNGLFGLAPYWRAPLEAYERVEVLKGPAAALYGMPPSGSVGGVVNLVPKRAGAEPLTRVTAGAMSNSVASGHADIGRRFGPDGAFGARLNLMHRQGDTAIRGQSIRESLASLGMDYRQRAFRASLDVLWQQQRTNNVVRQFALEPTVTQLPKAPSGKIAYPGYGYSDGQDRMALLKAEYDLTQSVTAYAAYGQRSMAWDAVAGNPVLQNNAGDYTFFGGWQRIPLATKSFEAGLRGAFTTGGIAHSATLAFTRLDEKQRIGFYTGYEPGESNIYSGQRFPTPSTTGIDNPIRPYLNTRLSSVALADTMSFMQDRLLLTLGVRHQKIGGQNFDFRTGAPNGPAYDKGALTPFAGLVYKPQKNISLYASYVEGLSRGATAPMSAAIRNPGESMPPFQSKQKEIGVKFDHGSFMTSLSLYELTQPSAGTVNGVFGVHGLQRNRGLEASIAGELTRGVRLLGGATLMRATIVKSDMEELRGKHAIGVPKAQVNLGADWDTGFLPGLTLSGRAIHTTRAPANDINTLHVPAWTRFDVGARYATRVGGKALTLRLNVENLMNRNYYGVGAAGYLFVGSPRTVSLTASMDL